MDQFAESVSDEPAEFRLRSVARLSSESFAAFSRRCGQVRRRGGELNRLHLVHDQVR